MDIVIDTSVLIAVISNEPSRKKALELTVGNILTAPVSVHWEIGNALSAMLKRKQLTEKQAYACLDVYQKIPIRLVEVDLQQSLDFAVQLNIYAYDAYLIACAVQLRAPLLTLDLGLRKAATIVGVNTPEL